MSESEPAVTEMQEAIDREDWERLEELWLEALDQPTIPVDALLEIRKSLWKAGRKNLARTLLELLAETLESKSNAEGALGALRELVRLTDKRNAELNKRLEDALRQSRAGSPSLDAVLAKHPIHSARRPLETLEIVEQWLNYDVGTVVEVRGQGVGKITDANLKLDTFKVDIGSPRPISVPFGAANKYLRPLREGSFLYQKVMDRPGLVEFVAARPGEALVELLEDLEGPADVSTIKAALEGVLPTTKWTSWWAKARKHPRILSSGSGSRLRYRVSESAEQAADTLLEELRAAKPRRRLALVRRVADRGKEQATAAAKILGTSLDALVESDPGLAWETATMLAELPGSREAADAAIEALAAQSQPLQLLAGIEDRLARSAALEAIRRAHPEDWHTSWSTWMLEETNPGILTHVATVLEQEGHTTLLDEALEAIFRNPHRYPAQFIWACETMTDPGAPEPVRRRMTPSVLEHLPDTLTRKEYAGYRARAKALLDGGQVAIRIMLEKASPQQAQRFADRLVRISTLEPQRLRLIQQAAVQRRGKDKKEEEAEPAFVATLAAIEAKRAELKNLLEHEIPKTLKGIQAAAAEGDLRENFEYHMLRDRQELLSARAATLQVDLARVKVLEPGAADTSRVNMGTVVHLERADGTPIEPVTIVGQWDADISRRLFANGTDLAQSLLGHSVGDEVTIEGDRATITAIEPWTPKDQAS